MCAKLSKRMTKVREEISTAVQPGKIITARVAFELLKKLSQVKFVETVNVSINLGVDPKKSDQMVRGAVLLPKGTGKTMRVAVATQGTPADLAKKAGADIVGFEDLAEQIKAGKFDFDVLIATPDAMPLVGKLGPILGPRGLMPNPKTGTVTTDVVRAIENVKKGQIQYKTDKGGIVHCRIGTVQFEIADLHENLVALLTELKRVKPSTSKGVYIRKITVSTTMGPGLAVDPINLE